MTSERVKRRMKANLKALMNLLRLSEGGVSSLLLAYFMLRASYTRPSSFQFRTRVAGGQK
jgi:CRISPR/Cas system-associated protein Cas7 (RAMP superfamily)